MEVQKDTHNGTEPEIVWERMSLKSKRWVTLNLYVLCSGIQKGGGFLSAGILDIEVLRPAPPLLLLWPWFQQSIIGVGRGRIIVACVLCGQVTQLGCYITPQAQQFTRYTF